MTLVRIDLSAYRLRFLNESHDGPRRPLPDWVRDFRLAGGINAITIIPFNPGNPTAAAEIYDAALKKMQSFVSGRILETKIAGKIAASLCRCFVKVR